MDLIFLYISLTLTALIMGTLITWVIFMGVIACIGLMGFERFAETAMDTPTEIAYRVCFVGARIAVWAWIVTGLVYLGDYIYKAL